MNVTEIVQLKFMAKVLGLRGQLFVCAKSPLVAMLLIVSGPLPMFDNVTFWAGVEVIPTVWLANVMLSVDRLTTGPAPLPVPVSDTVAGLLEELLLSENVPARVPDAVGTNWTLKVHDDFAASGLVQLFEPELKSPGFDPPNVGAENVSCAVPLLVNVMP